MEEKLKTVYKNLETKSSEIPKSMEQRPQEPVDIKTFTVTKEGVDELVQCINAVVQNKYVKNTLFNCINGVFVPNMP